jgi:hypothetical protein
MKYANGEGRRTARRAEQARQKIGWTAPEDCIAQVVSAAFIMPLLGLREYE